MIYVYLTYFILLLIDVFPDTNATSLLSLTTNLID